MELAATNVIRSVSTVFFVIVNSFAATTGSLVSNLLGAGQKAQVIPLCNRVIRLGYAIGFPLVILVVAFYRPIIGIYTESTALMQIAHLPFVVMLLNYVFALPGYVYMNDRYGGDAHDIYFPVDNHRGLSDLFVEHQWFQYVIVRLLDGRISVCDITRPVVCHLSQI